MANLRIKLVKSLNGRLEKHILTAHSLGLRKIASRMLMSGNRLSSRKNAELPA